ncbi:MAG: FMN-binding negative transcriptional regulator [Saprospiraceae bacterium]|nr:FMN-binding negative transcriptional regulator [Saprospiraceae bacterium]
MYVAPLNQQTDQQAIKKYVDDHGFATLVSSCHDEIATTHTPLVFTHRDGRPLIHGHIARANGQTAHIQKGCRATAIFMDAHTYISSSWYDHVNVPTWNYLAVHMQGRLQALDDEATVASLHELVGQYEGHDGSGFHISQMTHSDLRAHLRGLQGFVMEVDHIEASWKLSQNRDDHNHATIVAKLRERGDEFSLAIAREMEKWREDHQK